MAVELNVTSLANEIATPPVKNAVQHFGGRLRVKSETISSTSTDANGSIYRFFRVKAHDSIKSLMLYNDTLATTASTIDVGFHVPKIGGAAVDINAIGSAIACNTAVTVGAEIRFETHLIETVNEAVWETANVAADPGGGTEYDLTITVLARGTTPVTGDITLVMIYTAGD